MKIGYACLNMTLGKEGGFKTTTVKSASKLAEQELHKKIKGLTIDNLYTTYKILQWNIDNNMFIYRMTSDMIPLATHELNSWEWWSDKDVINICNKIKDIVKTNNIRISMHPSQYTLLSSSDDKVINNSIKDLEYHSRLSNLVGNETILIHCGGKYGNPQQARENIIKNFSKLSADIQSKLHLENDDKTYNVEETLNICKELNIPMIIDFHHDRCLPSYYDIENRLEEVISTWHGKVPKCHLSTGRESITDKKHADYISVEDFNRVVKITKGRFDIMLEAKCKELALAKLREVM